MSYIINAWLERSEPSLTVISRITGQTLLDWQGPWLRELIECGEVDVQALLECPRDTVDTVKQLVLADSGYRHQGRHW